MGIFSTMGNLGLGDFDESKIMETNSDAAGKHGTVEVKDTKSPEEIEKEALFDKTYECPVCNLTFKTKCVRAGKVRLVSKDSDLRPIYNQIDPIKYDVITCEKCGYSALGRYFGKLMNRQIKDISEQIGAKFNGMESAVGKDIFTYDDAITRYQLALITTMVKKAKSSERAYTCLKYAWVLRGKRQYLAARPEGIKPEENRSLYMDERECLKNAYEGFLKAISSETFPIAGMDENTLNYLLADLARRLGKNEDALRLLSMVITSRSTPSRMKDEALKLKDMIRESIKNNK